MQSSSLDDVTAAVDAEATPATRRPLWLRVEIWLALAALALALPVLLTLRHRHAAASLPKLGHLASFSLVRESGARLTSAELAGKVWVADFVYLGCSESCPMLSTRMSKLQRQLVDEEQRRGAPLPAQLVTITIDPANDTPARLAEYASRWQADPKRWIFATGSTADIQHIVADGFKVAYGKVDDGAGAFEIMHGNWFVLVDGEGAIRGYYSSDHPEEMKALGADVLRLSGELSRQNGGRS
jgi:protein SCO1/2